MANSALGTWLIEHRVATAEAVRVAATPRAAPGSARSAT